MTGVEMGIDGDGRPVVVDLEELLATRLLVQGNSGSGKSHLLRRLLEESAELVQQVVIDPEGDFASLADAFSHLVIDAADYSVSEIDGLGRRVRSHRASVVLNLENLEMEGQMRCAAAFLGALFDAPREHWFPALVVVDEAQLFAPAAGGDVPDDVRRASLGAMTNLMCRGRKRGLAGVVATQRLAKLAKNVAAEASNFLMGRTFLDIDMQRAADLLGMERRQAEAIRDLGRGEFLALGPALSRRPLNVRIGEVRTGARSAAPKLVPLPPPSAEGAAGMADLLLAPGLEQPAAAPPPPAPVPVDQLLRRIEAPPTAPAPAPAATLAAVPELPPPALEEREEAMRQAIAEIVADGEAPPPAAAFQDFVLRCRMRGVPATLDMAGFARRLALARAGVDDEEEWGEAIALAAALPEEMLAPFLALARAARECLPCPSDEALAALYRTTSPGRARRMLAFVEEKGLIVCRVDLAGKRSVSLPHLGWTTAPAAPGPARPTVSGRVAAREPRPFPVG